MALRIRLRQQGRKNGQTYRIVVTDARNPRDGKYLEKLGWYDPSCAEKDCVVAGERILFWFQQGAELSPCVEALIARVSPQTKQAIEAVNLVRKEKRVAERRARRRRAKLRNEAKATA